MTVAEVAGGILSAMLAEKKRPVMIQASYRDRLAASPLPSWCTCLVSPARREPATVTVPAGFVLVDVVLPKQKAFIVKKWAEAAKAKVEAARKGIVDGSFAIFKGPIKDNKGNTVIADGTTYIQTEPKLEGMNYPVEGVLGATS